MIVYYDTDVQNITEFCHGKLIAGDSKTVIENITSDSRISNDKSLFVPLRGEKFDGHDYIEELIKEKRISAVLTMKPGFTEIAKENSIALIKCSDTLRALGLIASQHRDLTDPFVIGITGTNGKTTTKEILYSILNESFSVIKNEKNYNNEIGVPFTLLELDETTEVAVVEMGMNHTGEIERLSRITKPDISIITNIGEGHLEFLNTIENVALAKSEIIFGMKKGTTLLMNGDDGSYDIIKNEADNFDIKVKTFGLSKELDYYPENYSFSKDGIAFTMSNVEFFTPIYGIHNLYNVVASIAVAIEYGVSMDSIKKGLEKVEHVSGRSEIIDKGFIIINDTYNSNPLSSRYALKSVKEMFPEKRKIAVLSDMKELGDGAEAMHREIGVEFVENSFDMLFLYGDMSNAYRDGALSVGFDENSVFIYDDKEHLTNSLNEIIDENDVVLVKGSRSMKMDEVVNLLIK